MPELKPSFSVDVFPNIIILINTVNQCDDRVRAIRATYAHALSVAVGSQTKYYSCEPTNITISALTAILPIYFGFFCCVSVFAFAA